jgi:hypothetical protein
VFNDASVGPTTLSKRRIIAQLGVNEVVGMQKDVAIVGLRDEV